MVSTRSSLIDHLLKLNKSNPAPAKPEPERFLGSFLDLRNKPRTKERGEAQGKRSWKDAKGICLHQTAVVFSRAERMLNVPAHAGTMQDGQVVLLHDPTAYLFHAHRLNRYDIGIEVSCRAAGIEGDASSFWRSSDEIKNKKQYKDLVSESTDIQLEATRNLCRYYIELVSLHGGKIEFMHAHRQGHSSRRSDPGSRIWQEVTIPIMKEFNLSCGPVGWKAGSGKPIPEIWDSTNGKGIAY